MLRHFVSAILVAYPVPAALAQGVNVKVAKDHIDFLIGDELATRYHTAGYAKPIFWPIMRPRQRGDDPGLADRQVRSQGGNRSSASEIGLVLPWRRHSGRPGAQAQDQGSRGRRFLVRGQGARRHRLHQGRRAQDQPRTRPPSSRTTNGARPTASRSSTRAHVSFHDFGKARLIVLDIDLLASTYPLTFGDTKEGSMGIRINEEIIAGKKGKGKIQNAEGKVGEKECWGQLSAWCDYSGPIDGKLAGLADSLRSEEHRTSLLAQSRLRTDGGQSVRPGQIGIPRR